jgi:signal transduction histidine kinase
MPLQEQGIKMSISKVVLITREDWLALDLQYRLRRLSYKMSRLVIKDGESILGVLQDVQATIVLLDSEFLNDARVVGAIEVMDIPILCFNLLESSLIQQLRSRGINCVADVQDDAVLDAAIRATLKLAQTQTRLTQHKALVWAVDHEIRTPLSSLLLNFDAIEELEQEVLSQTSLQKLESLERSRQSVKRIVQLLDRSSLLCLSQTGDLSWSLSAIHLPSFCLNLIAELMQDHPCETHAKLVFSDYYFTGFETVYFDRTTLTQVLTNLLTNALKYSAADQIVYFDLKVSAHSILIQVQDQGIGIAESDRDRIFNPFYRGQNTRSIQGTGMGLAIVHQLVSACQGSIELESEIGEGSTFTVILPLQASVAK